ncbi:pyruvate kinase [Candidatus Peregrinibacteria bacterium RIFOXYA2_FULL_33_7]|nr:MAG: pyruvate kinase [Candidatus Peregrinibacteria bacterium RIFOXYA2_FULL_33_7]
MKKTKIICTLGPASEKVSTLKKMINAGMNCARLNFSHGTYENFALLVKNCREASKQTNKYLSLIQDLQGPKIRVGELPEKGIELKNRQNIILSTLKAKNTIPIQYKGLPHDVNKGDTILMDDGLLELEVLSTNKKNQIKCQVIHGGILKSHKGINVPTASISANPLSEKDKKDLLFGAKFNFDYIALSFVRSGKDIIDLRKLLEKNKIKSGIIAKIERPEAIENIEEIIKESDAIMVARGDLGVEISPEKVPVIQKKIVHLSRLHAKPVIVATQMLQSMIENPRATRAEISDAATTVFEHADAFMLSNETSVGEYPLEATKTLANVAKETEKEIYKQKEIINDLEFKDSISATKSACKNACDIASDINAKYIVVISAKGYTTRLISRHRPKTPIITITNNKEILTKLPLIWGINQIIYDPKLKLETPYILKILNKFLKRNDNIVLVNIQKNNSVISSIKI